MNTEERKILGAKARAARKALGRGVRQQDIADKAGVSLGVISNLENGKTIPQPAHRRQITKALGQDIFGDEIADATRDAWPADVQSYTDAIGLYLAELPVKERAAVVARWMADLLKESRQQQDGATTT